MMIITMIDCRTLILESDRVTCRYREKGELWRCAVTAVAPQGITGCSIIMATEFLDNNFRTSKGGRVKFGGGVAESGQRPISGYGRGKFTRVGVAEPESQSSDLWREKQF